MAAHSQTASALWWTGSAAHSRPRATARCCRRAQTYAFGGFWNLQSTGVLVIRHQDLTMAMGVPPSVTAAAHGPRSAACAREPRDLAGCVCRVCTQLLRCLPAAGVRRRSPACARRRALCPRALRDATAARRAKLVSPRAGGDDRVRERCVLERSLRRGEARPKLFLVRLHHSVVVYQLRNSRCHPRPARRQRRPPCCRIAAGGRCDSKEAVTAVHARSHAQERARTARSVCAPVEGSHNSQHQRRGDGTKAATAAGDDDIDASHASFGE